MKYFRKVRETVRSGKTGLIDYYIAYTGVFAVMCLLVFGTFIISGKTLISNEDGLSQHYRALVYYGKYLRKIIYTLIHTGSLVIPGWDFAIGEGADILKTLHYYVIGDPMYALSVLVPTSWMWLFYGAVVILKMYLSGAFFSALCFVNGIKNRWGIMVGAFTYTFCMYAMLNANRHPFFLTPMVYLPLLILGIELYMQHHKRWVFVCAVFLSAISQFYFFYILALVAGVYGVVRVFVYFRKKPAMIIRHLFGLAALAILGVLLSSGILLPVLSAFMDSDRGSLENANMLLYPLTYYTGLPERIIASTSESNYWLYIGVSVISLPAAFLVWKEKGMHRTKKVLMVIALLIICLPPLGRALNGFSYVSNRWIWACSMLLAYIVTVMWSELFELTHRDWKYLLICSLVYAGVCAVFISSRTLAAFSSLLILFFIVIALSENLKYGRYGKEGRQLAVFFLSMLSIVVNSYNFYSKTESSYVDRTLDIAEVSDLNLNETAAIRAVEGKNAGSLDYRYSGKSFLWNTRNANMNAGISSTSFYWSISSSSITDFRDSIGVNEPLLQCYTGYDDREALMSLAGVRYYVTSWDSDKVPHLFGFPYVGSYNVNETETQQALEDLKAELGTEELTESQINAVTEATAQYYSVYKNKYALPLAYTYDSTMSRDEWESYNFTERQEILLQAMVTEEQESEGAKPTLTGTSMDYEISCNNDEVSVQGNSFVVTEPGASVTLNFDGTEDTVTYLLVNGLHYKGASVYDLYFGEQEVDPLDLYSEARWNQLSENEKSVIRQDDRRWIEPDTLDLTIKTDLPVTKTLSYYTPNKNVYSGKHDYAVNMLYTTHKIDSLTVTFPEIGIYSFDELEVVSQPMDNYVEQIRDLGEETLTDMKIGTDSLSGKISLKEDKWLCFAIPYSEGWTATVDGREMKLERANLQYMGLRLSAGNHTVKLHYSTPYLKEGVLISGLSFILLLLVMIGNYVRIITKKTSAGDRYEHDRTL